MKFKHEIKKPIYIFYVHVQPLKPKPSESALW